MVVGVLSARLGPIDEANPRNALTLALQIINRSAKPMKHPGWSKPEIKVVLRDRYGNFYNRIPAGPKEAAEIKPGETISENLVFEPTAFGSELTLDLPLEGSEKFLFMVPAGLIQRGAAGTATAAAAVPAPAAAGTTTAAKGAAAAPASPTTPAAGKAPDPENDPKLRLKIRGDYNESMAEINRRKLGKSTNEAVTFKRRETAKLVKKLAEDYELTEDQIKRIVGLKG